MSRKIYYWKLRSTELQLGERTLVMGVLNITPDSFFDGGRFLDPDKAYARAMEMEEQGADIIDIGSESTRPESKRISADEEWQRLVPVLKLLRGKINIPISLDTYKSETAERALEYGVEILNDPSGLTFDAGLAKIAANGNAGLILNHMRGTPETWGSLPPLPDVTGSVLKDLDATTSRARRAGVEKNRIMVDPGLGFGKRKEQNSEILAQLGRLSELDYPIIAAPSHKSFLSHSGDGGETLFATAAAVTAAILHGAHIVRVHDVSEMRAVVMAADEIARLGTIAAKPDEQADERHTRTRAISRTLPAYMGEDRHPPMRPPVSRPVVSAVAEPVETPVMKPVETPETLMPAAATATPVVRRPPQDKPSKGWGPATEAPRQNFGDRPARPAFADRGPRQDFGDRPPRPVFGDRAPRKDFGERPQRPAFADRGAPRKDFGGRPPRPPFADRGPRQDFGDRPQRPPTGDRGPRKDFNDRPSRPPFGDRGPRKDFGGRPSGPQPSGDRGPRRDFGAQKDSNFRPSGPPSGDRGPRRDGPPGGSAGGRPPQGRPPQRPFRKRP